MAVYRLFRNKAFEPEAITVMTSAYADVCRALGLSDRDLPAADVVAKTVIEFAQRGARDQGRLRDCVLQALRDQPDDASAHQDRRTNDGVPGIDAL